MSIFNPESFLDVTLTEPTTKRPPLPAGDYTAVLMDTKARAWTGKTDSTKSGVAIDITLEVTLSPELAAIIGQPVINLFDSIMLDSTPSGSLDNSPGKNRRLRLYREALNMNKAGESFSIRAMAGRLINLKVKHEIYQGDIQERVDSVAAV